METIGDLPAHPLFVHVPVVVMPATMLLVATMAARRSWRLQLRWWLVACAGLLLVSTVAATTSGEAFNDLLRNTAPIKEHRELAQTTQVLVGVLFLASVGMAFTDRWAERRWMRPPPLVAVGPMAAVLVVSVLATVWMVRTGDSGARAVWENVVPDE